MSTTSTGLTTNPATRPTSPPPAIASSHFVQFYEDDSFLLDSLAKSIGPALLAGDAAVVIATPEHRSQLAYQLKARGFDLEVSARHGGYYSLDAAETLANFMVDGTPDQLLFDAFMGNFLSCVRSTVQSKSSRLVLFGEMVALLWSEGNFAAALKLEQLWNNLAETYTFHLHCAYPMKDFDREEHGEAFRSICAEHSHVVPTENYTAIVSEEGRLRHVSQLQQRAQTAANETAGRLRAEEALRRSEKLAAIGQLAAGVAHEINNPLEVVSNAIYLARSSSPADIASYLEIADRELARVAQITRQTLGFYRENASPESVKLSELLDDVLTLYSRKLQAKNIVVRKQYRDEFEIWAQPGELRQVFANQVANAIYAMPQHGCLTVKIRKSRSWSNDHRPGTTVTLVDTGTGISQESIPKIFEPFFTTKQDDGNGLGLWITHDIVTRHGGAIRAKSNTRPGASGTIFTTFLPHQNSDAPASL